MRRLRKGDVAVRFGTAVTGEMIAKESPDAVILAAGALPSVSPIPGLERKIVHDARDVLMGKAELKSPAVVLGAGYVGMETADFLVERGIAVSVIEMSKTPPVLPFTAHGYWLHRRLKKSGGSLLLNSRVIAVETDAVRFVQEERELSMPAAMVVTALGARSETELEGAIRERGIPCITVGDAVQPRRLLEAVHEGARAGREL